MASQVPAQQPLDGPAPDPSADMPAPAPAPQPTPEHTPETESEDTEVMLLVVDGAESYSWCVSKKLLHERAPFFYDMCSTINVPGWRPETVESFVHWLKTGEIRVRGLVNGYNNVNAALEWEPSHNHRDDALWPEPQAAGDLRPWYTIFGNDPFAWTLARILDLYTFAVVGDVKALMTECVIIWQRRLCAPYNVILFAPLLNAVVRHGGHGVDSPLTKFLVDWVALTMDEPSWDKAKIDSLPPTIIAEILRRTLRRARNGLNTPMGVPDPNTDWCRYHAHGPGPEQVACMARRSFDWDVRIRNGGVLVAEPEYQFTTSHQTIQGALPPPSFVEGQPQNVGLEGIKVEEGIQAEEHKPNMKAEEQKPNMKAEEQKPNLNTAEHKPSMKVAEQKPNLKAEENEPPKKKHKRTKK